MAPGGDRLRIDVPVGLAHLGEVRGHLVDAARAWGFGDLHDLEIVVSELVTNAITHTGGADSVECRLLAPGEVEVAVRDGSADLPRTVAPYEHHTRGHGLVIVESIAQEWGVRERSATGKTVWARLVADAPTSPPVEG